MAVRARRVTVTNAATELTDRDTDSRSGSGILIRPAADIYVGGSDVTTAQGYLVAAGAELALDLGSGERLWGRTASGSSVVSVLRAGA